MLFRSILGLWWGGPWWGRTLDYGIGIPESSQSQMPKPDTGCQIEPRPPSPIPYHPSLITLLSGGLESLPRALRLARGTMANVRQNLVLAFLYNLLALPVAAGILYPLVGHVTSPMLAAAAMSLSSLSVIANSLRLRRLDLG